MALWDPSMAKCGDELLNREIFYTAEKVKVPIEAWRKEYNQIRPYATSLFLIIK